MQIREEINFKEISLKTGIRKGKIFFSPTFNSWVISGHKDIDLVCIEPPKKIGEIINGMIVKEIKIKDNSWVFYCE